MKLWLQRWRLRLLLVSLCLPVLCAVEPVPEPELLPDQAEQDRLEHLLEQVLNEQMAAPEPAEALWLDGRPLPAPAIPGRAQPVESVAAQAWEVDWNEYRSLIVVDHGQGLRRRAWVATRKLIGGEIVVAHAGTAFIDPIGEIHIDCQRALPIGPMAGNWIPDSFAISPEGSVRVIDDNDQGSGGRVVASTLSPMLQRGKMAADQMVYNLARVTVRWMFDGVL